MRTSVSIMLMDLYAVMGAISYEALGIVCEDLRRTEEKNYYRTIIKNNFQQRDQINYSPNRDYIRKYQDRQNYNRPTKMPFRGLQKIVNQNLRKEIKQIKAKNEKSIKEAFARKIKNKTYYKRNHSKNNNTY